MDKNCRHTSVCRQFLCLTTAAPGFCLGSGSEHFRKSCCVVQSLASPACRGGGKAAGFDGEVTSQSASRTAPLCRGAKGAVQFLRTTVIARPVRTLVVAIPWIFMESPANLMGIAAAALRRFPRNDRAFLFASGIATSGASCPRRGIALTAQGRTARRGYPRWCTADPCSYPEP